MAYDYLGRNLERVGVVGSGQIGPDIALYFSKVLSPYGVRISVVDVSEDALAKGRERVDKKVNRGVQGGAFTPEQGEAMKQAVTFTSDYSTLSNAGFVVEAATEDKGIKHKIFALLEETCPKGAILASNSSHMEPEVIGAEMADKSRSCVIHYFFPAERNPIVEIIPGADTDPDLTNWLMRFYERIGKVPIQVKSRYGYAMDPIFEGLFHAATLAVEAGLGSIKEVDYIATQAIGQTIGPFTAMNLTGGNPITAVGLDHYNTKIMPWYYTTDLLKKQLESGQPWEVPARGEVVAVEPEKAKAITDWLQGAYLGIVDEILTAGLVSLADLEMAVGIALDMTPPVQLIKKLGLKEATAITKDFIASQKGFNDPKWLSAMEASGKIADVEVVGRQDKDGVAVLTIRRPKVLNALSEDCFAQLHGHFNDIKADSGVKAAVLTGFGVKAFVSGADVHFLSRIDSPEKGMEGSRDAQALTALIEGLGKPVICALNGMAFGGGLEIAMACTARITRSKLKVMGGQPEANLGIIPGAGGTQRLPRLVGIEKASALLRTGRPFSSKDAVEMGLCLEEVEFDNLIDRAIEVAKEASIGKRTLAGIRKDALTGVPDGLPDLDIGHLSKAIDDIMVKTILDGAKGTLADGLDLECRMFGEVCKTQDMKIGIENFLTKGPRSKAEFVHA